MSRRLAVLAGAILLLSIAPLYAQNAVSQETYGAGVHAYFSGDFRHAYHLLTSLIDTSANDPRAYYFRGMALLHLGRADEAKQDFLQGAKLETKDPDQTHNVSKALERIQGDWRMLLEQYRAEARLLAFQRSEQLRKERYEAIRREENRVLQQQAEGAPPAKPAQPPVPAPAEGLGAKPAPAPVEKQPSEAAPGPAPAEKKPAPAGPEENPFGTTKPAPAPAPAGKKPAPAGPEENPFGTTKPAAAGRGGTGILPVVPQATGETPVPPTGPVSPAKPAASGDDVLGLAISALGIKTPAGSGAAGPATPPGKTAPAVAAPGGAGISPVASPVAPVGTVEAPVPPGATLPVPAPAKKAAVGVVAPDDGDLFAPATVSGAKPGAGQAAAKTPAEDEPNPFLDPAGSAAKGKSAAKKSGATAKSAIGKKPAAKAPADDADPGNPFLPPDSPAGSDAGKKTGN